MNKWVLVSEMDNCGIWCHGVFDKYVTALGTAMEMIWELHEGYLDDGDFFGYTEAEPTEGESGYVITVQYKKASWEKLNEEYYYILSVDEGKDE
jgi:hypothetical protein